LNLNLTLSESDFDIIVEKTNKLTSDLKTSINKIKTETEMPLQSANKLKALVSKELEVDVVKPNEIDEHINETISLMHSHINTSNELKNNSALSQKTLETNSKINETLIGISLNLIKLNDNNNLVEEILSANNVNLNYEVNKNDIDNIKTKLKTSKWNNDNADQVN
jgi:hypothetical protein